MDIGTNIRKFRRERDWTQAELAAKVGIQKQNVSRYENGRVEPRETMLGKLAEALGVTREELLGESDPREEVLLDDPELRRLFKEVADLPERDREALKRIMDLVVKQHRVQAAIAS